MSVQLHHVALVVAEPERSAEFYESIFGLTRLDRPPFKIEGVWLDCGPGLQLHLTRHPQGTFRSGGWTTTMATLLSGPTTSRASWRGL